MDRGISFAKFSLDYQASTFLHQTFYGAPRSHSDAGPVEAEWRRVGCRCDCGRARADSRSGHSWCGLHQRPELPFHVSRDADDDECAGIVRRAIHVPDVVAAGVRIGPFSSQRATWQVTTEYKRVQNSELRSSYVTSFLRVNDPSEKAYAFSDRRLERVSPRCQVQCCSSTSWRPAFRGGLFCSPDHSVQYSSPATNDLYDERFRASLSTGKDLMHYTFGLGLVTSRQLEFNFAGDVTSRSTVISASAIVRFRKAPPKPPDLPPLE